MKKSLIIYGLTILLCAAGFYFMMSGKSGQNPLQIFGKVKPPAGEALDTRDSGEVFYVTADRVRVRSSSDYDSDTNILPGIRLNLGDSVIMLGKNPKQMVWHNTEGYSYRVKLVSGEAGWVFHYLSKEPVLPPPPVLPQAHSLQANRSGWREWVDKAERSWDKNFGSWEEQQLAQLVNACNYTDPTVRNTAVQMAGKNLSGDEFDLAQVCNLFDFAVKDWNYINDPGAVEYVAKASESIENRHGGDCDDYAVLVFSLITSIGGDCRIIYANGNFGGHAFAEIRVGKGIDAIKKYLSIRYRCPQQALKGFRKDPSGDWYMNLDWFEKHPAGAYLNWRSGVRFDIDGRQAYPL